MWIGSNLEKKYFEYQWSMVNYMYNYKIWNVLNIYTSTSTPESSLLVLCFFIFSEILDLLKHELFEAVHKWYHPLWAILDPSPLPPPCDILTSPFPPDDVIYVKDNHENVFSPSVCVLPCNYLSYLVRLMHWKSKFYLPIE